MEWQNFWQCGWKVHNVLLAFGDQGVGFLLVAINLDRLIAVAFPMVSPD